MIYFFGQAVADNGDREDGRKQARGVLWEAAAMKDGSIPGTALIALFNLSGREGFEKERIAASALEMVRNASYGEPAKITALQIGAKLGERSMLPLARTLAAAGPVPVRVSAMACLGMLGDGSDLPMLKTAAAGGDIRLATAAHEAIRKLESRK